MGIRDWGMAEWGEGFNLGFQAFSRLGGWGMGIGSGQVGWGGFMGSGFGFMGMG